MKGALAAVEIWVEEAGESAVRRRLSLVIGTPERSESGGLWLCRVALADLHRPQTLEGRDSLEALVRAVEQARSWIEALRGAGHALFRDRAGDERFSLPERGRSFL